MRVIFLDFDGVLNVDTDEPDTSGELWTERWLDERLVGRLAHLVAQSGARVVISSSWRQRRTLAELEAMLALRGYGGGVHSVTPRLPRPAEGEHLVRASEIAAWLDAHAEVSAFVILDDDRDFGPLTARHVRTDSAVGLTEEDVRRALHLLGDTTPFEG
jgi:hypothetical protein